MNQPHITDTPGSITLASVEKEFGWTCWRDSDECYGRRPQTPHGDYDARGDDPADLREAIALVLEFERPGEHATSSAAPEPTDAGRADLVSLASEMTTRGYRTILRTSTSAQPCLHVVNPRTPALSEQVHAHDGSYFFSWGQPIAACGEPATAAAILARVLGAAGG